jgi:hypothetical protein
MSELDLELKRQFHEQLKVPETLLPDSDFSRALPLLDDRLVEELRGSGWSKLGIMVAVIDSDGRILMLRHRVSDKSSEGMLGPLGETTKSTPKEDGFPLLIEQPLETLYRGLIEETAVEDPTSLELYIHKSGGWEVNQWPRGIQYPDEFNCAISFPVFVTDEVKDRILAIQSRTEEIDGATFVYPHEIMGDNLEAYRPGVQSWLAQLTQSDLINPIGRGGLEAVNFTQVTLGMQDVDLR